MNRKRPELNTATRFGIGLSVTSVMAVAVAALKLLGPA